MTEKKCVMHVLHTFDYYPFLHLHTIGCLAGCMIHPRFDTALSQAFGQIIYLTRRKNYWWIS